MHETGKFVVSADGTRAAFDTGLVTEDQDAIYATFTAGGSRPWTLDAFVTASARVMPQFGHEMPEPARFFDDPAELVYDQRRPLFPNLEHILDERHTALRARFSRS